MSGWVGPSSSNKNSNNSKNFQDETVKYRALVVDSGPIIKHTSGKLFGKADVYYTVPGVMDEIRDAKARQSLEQWPRSASDQPTKPKPKNREPFLVLHPPKKSFLHKAL